MKDSGSVGSGQGAWGSRMRPSAGLGGVVLAAFAMMSGSFSARAADIGVPAAPQPSYVIPAIYSWTGPYLGLELGGGFGSSDWTDAFVPAVTATVNSSGVLVGGYTGINYQVGTFVIGADVDFDGTWIDGNTTDAPGNTLRTKVFWTSTATARFGVALDRLLLYFKAGGAFAYDRDYETLPTTQQAIGSTYRIGWTVGGGLDYAFTEHWAARLEYDYLSLANKGLPLTGPTAATTGNSFIGLNLSEAKAGLAYKF